MSYWKNKGEIKAKFSVHLIVQKDSAKRIASSDSEFRAFSVGFSSALLVDFEVHALMFVLVPQVFSRHISTHFCWMWFLQKWKIIFYTSQCLLYLVWRKLSNFAQCKFLEYFPKYRDQFAVNIQYKYSGYWLQLQPCHSVYICSDTHLPVKHAIVISMCNLFLINGYDLNWWHT